MAKMPKRRKSKDNPYTLEYIEDKNIYKVNFKNNKGNLNAVEISVDIYKAMDKFELEDISQMHQFERHIEHSELFEGTLNERAVDKPLALEDIVENTIINEELRKAIDSLSEIQKRRIKLYYFDGLTQQEIANREGTSLRAVQYTLNSAMNELKKILKNLQN